jgi:hypothetical protein
VERGDGSCLRSGEDGEAVAECISVGDLQLSVALRNLGWVINCMGVLTRCPIEFVLKQTPNEGKKLGEFVLAIYS